PGTNADPVVGLRGRTIVLWRDVDKFTTSLHALVQPMGLGHLVSNQVLADLNDEFAESHVVEIYIGCLQTMHERMTGRLVATPSVLVPFSRSARLLRCYSAHMMIQ